MGKNKEIDLDFLKKEYESLEIKIKNFCEELNRQISNIIDSEKIILAVPIQHRPKSWESLLDKHTQRRFQIKKSVLEMQDLAGLRIILLFRRDAEKIAGIIRENFQIVNEYNPAEKLEDNQFGYSSLHQVIKLRNEWLTTPTLRNFKDISAEIQVRTLAQHAWAEASNTLQYKNEDSVPKPLKRTVGRISAVLELVDLEFERALADREDYKIQIQNTDFSVNKNEALNIDLLQQILQDKLPEKNRLRVDDYSELFEELTYFDINVIGDLTVLIDEYLDKVMALEKKICVKILADFEKEILSGKKFIATVDVEGTQYTAKFENLQYIKNFMFFSWGGLIRMMLKMKFGKKWSDFVSKQNIYLTS